MTFNLILEVVCFSLNDNKNNNNIDDNDNYDNNSYDD